MVKRKDNKNRVLKEGEYQTAVEDLADDVVALDLDAFHGDQAVVDQDGRAGLHVLGQVLVGDGHTVRIALAVIGGQDEELAGLQCDLALLEGLHADLGSFGVQ